MKQIGIIKMDADGIKIINFNKCYVCKKEMEFGKEWGILDWPPAIRIKYLFCGDDKECHKKLWMMKLGS